MICNGYAVANNNFLKSFDANKPISYIICLDVNNSYGQYMMLLLPTEILDSVNPKDFNLDIYSNDGSIHCFLEDHLDYSDELHYLHNDYPLAGGKIKVT